MATRTGSVCMMAAPGTETPQHKLRGLVMWRQVSTDQVIIHRLPGADACLDGELPFGPQELALFLSAEAAQAPLIIWPRCRLERRRTIGGVEEYVARPI